MKKIVIAVLLIASICVPAFATGTEIAPFVGVSASLSFEDGVKFNGIEVYGKALIDLGSLINSNSAIVNRLNIDAKAGYLFSIDKNPAVSGVYVDVAADVDAIKTKDFSLQVKVGGGADFHIIDGQFKVNAGIIAGADCTGIETQATGEMRVSLEIRPTVEARYNFLNQTGTPSFNLEAGAIINIKPAS